MVGPNLPFGGLACGLVLGPLPSSCNLLSSLASSNLPGESLRPELDPRRGFCHNSCTFLAMYTFQEWVSEPKPVQLAINHCELARILLYLPSLRRIQREKAIR